MYHPLLIIGFILIIIGLVFIRIRYLPVLHPETELYINLLSNFSSEKKVKEMKEKTRVLFICIHNSGRSQMAETFLKAIGGDWFEVESAGLEPKPVNPYVIEVMEEVGYDLSENTSDSMMHFFKEGRLYDYVITVCDESVENKCPIFPGIVRRFHWPFPDPQKVTGTKNEKLKKIRAIRDDIKRHIESWVKDL
jgi:arsenate reductase